MSHSLFFEIDSPALSEPALASAPEVCAGNRIDTMIDEGSGHTPAPCTRS